MMIFATGVLFGILGLVTEFTDYLPMLAQYKMWLFMFGWIFAVAGHFMTGDK